MRLEGEVLEYLAELYGHYALLEKAIETDVYTARFYPELHGETVGQVSKRLDDHRIKMNRLYDLLKLGGHPEFTQ